MLGSCARENALGRGTWQGLSKQESRSRSQGNPPGQTNPLAGNPVCACTRLCSQARVPCNHISLPHLHCWSRASALQPSSSLQSSLMSFFFFFFPKKKCQKLCLGAKQIKIYFKTSYLENYIASRNFAISSPSSEQKSAFPRRELPTDVLLSVVTQVLTKIRPSLNGTACTLSRLSVWSAPRLMAFFCLHVWYRNSDS